MCKPNGKKSLGKGGLLYISLFWVKWIMPRAMVELLACLKEYFGKW